MAERRKKCFIRNMNHIDSSYHWKNWVGWISARQEIICNIKNVYFKKKGPKVENITFLHFIATFHNFALKIKIGWATKVFKCISKLRISMMYLSMRGYFSWQKIIIWSLKNQQFWNFYCTLLIMKLAGGFEILFSWPWGISLTMQLAFLREKFARASWNKLIILHGDMK